MALKTKRANKPLTDNSGYVVGTIKGVYDTDELPDREKVEGYKSQFEFHIVGSGNVKQINFRFWVGQTLNDEKFGDDGKEDYNRLTRLCLQTGLIKESDLSNLDEIELDLETLIGKEIKFKLEKSRKSQGLNVVDIGSIILINSVE